MVRRDTRCVPRQASHATPAEHHGQSGYHWQTGNDQTPVMTAWLGALRIRRTRVDTHEQTAARVAALPQDDPFGALIQLAAWLGELGCARDLDLPASLRAIEQLDRAASSHYRDATRRYLHEHERLPEGTIHHWSDAVEGCLTQLARRYQSNVVLWRTSAARHGSPKEFLVRSMAGGVRACAAILKWSYLRRTASPVGVWADMCTLYAASEAAACARAPVRWLPNAAETSVEREFLKGCMLAAAEPATMSPGQVDITERLAGYCAADLGISPGADPRCVWLVDLESGDPPREIDRTAALPARARTFGLVSDERFRRLLHLVQTDRLLPAAFGSELDKAGVMETLERLTQRWLSTAAEPESLAA